jgi:chromosomal replication initiation ATPase DnaA
LALDRASTYERDQFVVSDCNRDAVRWVDAWPAWPGACLALVGPEGSGKTHLARAWAASAGAAVLPEGPVDSAAIPEGPVLLEDVDRRGAEPALFALIDRAAEGGGLLLTARVPPRQWPAALPDLRSRLNALMVAEPGPPDDRVLEGVLLAFFRDRHIRPEPDVLPYLLRRMERSVRAAARIVEQLDIAADASRRRVTRLLAKTVLEAGDALVEPPE